MSKEQLKQELLTKVKPGIKPSDLKKMRGQIKPTTSAPNIPTPPPPPALKPKPEAKLPPPIVQTENKPQAKIKSFTCHICRKTRTETPRLIRVAVTDPEYNLVRGQAYPFCSACGPKIKEFNEYDLLNDNPHLWAKYPYSEAKEILELEFGIKASPAGRQKEEKYD